MISWPKGRLQELDLEECWELLDAHQVGRVAWCAGGRPQVVPVNYAIRDGAVWVRTTPDSRLATEGPGHHVSVEIDEIDGFLHAGVSVLVQGRCERVEAVSDLPPGLESWADGTRPSVLRVPAEEVTGRRLLPS